MCMSLREEQQGHRPPSIEEVKEEKPMEETFLVAFAPNASVIEELPPVDIDVSASPAFQCLDEMVL
ncbi:hypothetical protein PAMP_014990 [Pampus punctatissimus]